MPKSCFDGQLGCFLFLIVMNSHTIPCWLPHIRKYSFPLGNPGAETGDVGGALWAWFCLALEHTVTSPVAAPVSTACPKPGFLSRKTSIVFLKWALLSSSYLWTDVHSCWAELPGSGQGDSHYLHPFQTQQHGFPPRNMAVWERGSVAPDLAAW